MRDLARTLLTPDAIGVGITYIIVWTVIVISILWIIDAVERRRAERERAEREGQAMMARGLIAALVVASLVLFAGAFIADREGRAACEARHSSSTCTHILRG